MVTAAPPHASRAENLDVLRALAALMIVVGHAYLLSGRKVEFIPDLFSDLLVRQLATGVWLFFIMSGYLITRPFVASLIAGRELPDLRAYAIRRAFRIYPAYWVALTAVIAIQGLQGAALWHVPVHQALLHNLVPGRQHALFSVSWTLTLEVLFYVAVPLLAVGLRRLAQRRPIKPSSFAAGVVVTWFLSIIWIAAATRVPGRTGNWLEALFPAFWCFFCPGILLAIGAEAQATSRVRVWLNRFPRSRSALAVAVLAFVVSFVLYPTAGSPGPVALRWHLAQQVILVGYALVVGFALGARPWRERFGQWLVELGLISYGIYLFHAVFLAFFLSRWGGRFVPLPHTGALAFVVHVALLVGLTLPVAWLSWNRLEVPLNGFARRIARRDRDVAGETVRTQLSRPDR